MNADPRRDFAAEVVDRLRAAGFEAYWAGGCVRDLLLGLDPADYDVATSARPEQVTPLFRKTLTIGASFGVVKVLGRPGAGAGDVEVATFRSDGAYLDGRRPESVTFSTAEFDASRRDFTINGMFLDPSDGRILDFVGGRADLDARVLRAIGDPAARFAEDKLRLLRAVRFASRFGLTLDPATATAIEAMAPEVTAVSAERIGQELRRMVVHPTRVDALRLAWTTGLVAAVLPPVARLGAEPWERSLRVLGRLPDSPPFPLAFATVLLEAGPVAAAEVGRSLKLSNAEVDRLAWLVGQRRALVGAHGFRPSRLKRLLATPGTDDLLALHRAEALATGDHRDDVAFCDRYLLDRPDGPIDPPPLVNGHDLLKHGIRPGPGFARLLDRARDAQLDGTIATRDEAIALVDRIVNDEGGQPSPGNPGS